MCEERKQFGCKTMKSGNCTQDDLHGVRHGEGRIRNDVSHSPTGGLTHSSTRWEDDVHHLDMAFAILRERQAVRKWTQLVFHSSHVPLFFLPRNDKASHDILGFWNIINRLQTSFFKPSNLGTILSTKIMDQSYNSSHWGVITPESIEFVRSLKHFIFPQFNLAAIYIPLPVFSNLLYIRFKPPFGASFYHILHFITVLFTYSLFIYLVSHYFYLQVLFITPYCFKLLFRNVYF